MSQETKRAGRLQSTRFRDAWRSITRDSWILETIRQGVRVNIQRNLLKTAVKMKEPKELLWTEEMAVEQWDWRDLAEQWEAIEVVPEERIGESGELIHNLVTEQKNGRLCSNTKELNAITAKMKLKMESIKDVRQRLEQDNWLYQIDLSKFYWSMSIKPAHRRYFRFRMDGVLYQWRALPFGFKNSMQIMARIMAPVITKMEAFGIDVIIWVDDMILQLGTVKSIARQKALIALQILHDLGFLVNTEKTAKDVSKEVKFRGFCWNTKTFTISAPEKKLLSINKAAKKINMECASPKDLASLIGKVRYISQVHTHTIAWIVELEIHKNNLIKKGGWMCRAPVPEEARVEIRHWRSRSFLLSMPLRTELHHMIQTMGDAGPLGYGFQGFGDQAGLWTPQEQLKSTNWRELETWRRQVLDYSEDLMDEVFDLRNRLFNSESLHFQNLWQGTNSFEDGSSNMEIYGETQHSTTSHPVVSGGDQVLRSSLSAVGQRGLFSSARIVREPMLQSSDIPNPGRFCNTFFNENGEILFSEDRSISSSNRCLLDPMVQRDNLRFSPISSHSSNSLQGQSRECDTPPGPLIRPFSNLVPQNQQDQSYFPLYSSEGHSIPPRDLGPIFSLDDLIDPAVKQQRWGMTVGTTTLLGKAVGEDTSSRRDTNIEAFRRWLSSKELWRFSIIHIVEFLAQNQSSFANHRTAIASRLRLNAGIDIVEFPLMKRLSQAIRRECPIEPKYSEMWNLEILFDYLRKHLPEEGHFISHRARAVTLVRTSIAGRTSDVAHIHRPSMVWTETTVRFRFFHWKTQHTERRRFSKYYVIEKLPLEKIVLSVHFLP